MSLPSAFAVTTYLLSIVTSTFDAEIITRIVLRGRRRDAHAEAHTVTRRGAPRAPSLAAATKSRARRRWIVSVRPQREHETLPPAGTAISKIIQNRKCTPFPPQIWISVKGIPLKNTSNKNSMKVLVRTLAVQLSVPQRCTQGCTLCL